jgi:hypothetical protein
MKKKIKAQVYFNLRILLPIKIQLLEIENPKKPKIDYLNSAVLLRRKPPGVTSVADKPWLRSYVQYVYITWSEICRFLMKKKTISSERQVIHCICYRKSVDMLFS